MVRCHRSWSKASHVTFRVCTSSGLQARSQLIILQLTGINRLGFMRVRPPCRALDAPAPSLHVLHVCRVQRRITLVVLPVKLRLVDDDRVALLDAARTQRVVDARCLQHLVMRAGQGRAGTMSRLRVVNNKDTFYPISSSRCLLQSGASCTLTSVCSEAVATSLSISHLLKALDGFVVIPVSHLHTQAQMQGRYTGGECFTLRKLMNHHG